MEYTAVINRSYSMADECLQIVIEDTDTFDTFKERLFGALKITDYRANVQMKRLFEDTDLTKSLGYKDLQAVKHAAELMYPLEAMPGNLNLGENPAFEFSKNLASGEVLRIFLHKVDSYDDLNTAIKAIWEVIDSRLEKTNKRELAFLDYATNKVGYETRLKISMIMDILYGRALSETVKEKLKGAEANKVINEIRRDIEEDTNHVSS